MDDTMGHPARIGQLNGKWSILFRALMVVGAIFAPFFITLSAWLVTSIYDVRLDQAILAGKIEAFIDSSPRYTPDMAERDNLRLKAELLDDVHTHLEVIEERLDTVNKDIQSHSSGGGHMP